MKEKLLQRLVNLSLYGSTIEEVKEELVNLQLIRIVSDELIPKLEALTNLNFVNLEQLGSNENK